jgi:hypothetical protein
MNGGEPGASGFYDSVARAGIVFASLMLRAQPDGTEHARHSVSVCVERFDCWIFRGQNDVSF